MTSFLSRIVRLGWQIALFLAVGVKVMTPVGYMPTAIGDGWPFTLCDAGFHIGQPAQQRQRIHEGHDSPGDGGQNLHWKDCPLGALASAWAIPVEYVLLRNSIDTTTPFFLEFCLSLTAPVGDIRVRGPPQMTFIV